MRVGHLATAIGGEPALVPVSFVVRDDHVYSAIDAKPKSVPTERLRRVRYLRANPRAAFLVDHYEEEWGRLWYVLLEGPVRLLTTGAEHDRALAALRGKYPQYRRMPLALSALVIALDIAKSRQWRSAEPRPQPRAVRTASATRRCELTGSRSRDRRTGPRKRTGRRTMGHE